MEWISGIYNYFFCYNKNLLILGLDNAGKATLYYLLKSVKLSRKNGSHPSPIEESLVKNVNLRICELNGHQASRLFTDEYYPSTDAIIFLVDTCDYSRFEEALVELKMVLNNQLIKNCPILVLGNKIDRNNAVDEQKLIETLQINDITTGKSKTKRNEIQSRPLEVFMCSLHKNEGYWEGLKWLKNFI